MAETFQQLLAWVSANPGWAGAVVFLMAFAESLAMVGMVVPGVAIMFAVGALIGSGALDFRVMVLWAVIGAVAGDGLSFWLGKKYQRQLTGMWPFSRHPAMLDKGIQFFQRYGGKSVVLGRFFGPVRAVIPLVAGMMNMPATNFVFANVLSALIWAPAYLLPGMAFGASMELASEVALRLVILLVALVGSLWFLGWLSHRLFLLIQPRSKQLLQRVLQFGERHPRLRRIARALGDPRHPESAGLAMLAGLLVLSSSILIVIALLPQSPLLIADSALHLGLNGLHNPTGDHIMLALSALASSSGTLAMLIVVGLVLWISGLQLSARHWLAGAGGVWLLSIVLEALARQSPCLLTAIPDVYVLRAWVFFSLGAVLVATPVSQAKRWRVYSAATLLIVAVMFSQLYLGSTLTAVLHALGGGLIWSTALGMAYRTHGREQKILGRQALILAISLILLAFSSAISVQAPPPAPNLLKIQSSMSLQDWQQGGWRQLPHYRDDVLNGRSRPLNLQIAGSPAAFIDKLKQQGWEKAQTARGLSWLKLLASTDDIAQLPLLPHSHAGRMAYSVLSKPDGDRRQVIYLWPSTWIIEDSGQPVWLGEVTSQQKKQWLGMLYYPVSTGDGKPALDALEQDMRAAGMRFHTADNGELLLYPAGAF
ncbi:VTT domain-containing protein [Thiolapillus sp.]|uniref:VTT domain-containing protein n=1 Tax=Thiolapillus sp. TaxID=2017437 RepID=UPI0025FF2B07|nr:VTT domain-containing protein [Thiolapillus sp.]